MVLILSRGISTTLNKTSLGLYASFALWSFGKIYLHNPDTPENLAILFDKIDAIAWCSYPAISLWFSLLLANKTKLTQNKLFYAAIIFFPLLFITLHWSGFLMHLPEKRSYGWHTSWHMDSIWTYVYYVYYIGISSFSIALFLFTAARTELQNTKKQLIILAFSTLAPLLLGSYFQVLVPLFKLPGWDTPLTDISNIYIAIWGVGSYYAIVKHRLFSITPVMAADTIISSMSEALFLLGEDLSIKYVNNAASLLLNKKSQKLLNTRFSDYFFDGAAFKPFLVEVIKKESYSKKEILLKRGSGEPLPCLVSASVIKESGEMRGIVCVASDISALKKIETELITERDMVKKYLNIANIFIIVLDRDLNTVLMNKKALDVTGFIEQEVAGKFWPGIFIPEYLRGDSVKFLQNLMESGPEITAYYENSIYTRNMYLRDIKWTNTVLSDDSGKPVGLICAGEDITDTREIQEQLAKLSTGIEQSPASIVITDTAGNITYVNPKFCDVTGYTREEALGENPRMLKSGDWPKERYAELWATILSGREWHGEFHNKKKNGELFWESASISPIKNDNGDIISFIAVKEDITEEKKAQQELKESYEKLKELEILKTNFTSMVSHELRTPLTSIKGFLSFLLSGVGGPVSAQQKEFLEIIKNNSDRLLNLINDLLDTAKMEAGSFSIEKKNCNLTDVINSSVKDVRSLSQKKNIIITNKSASETFVISADDYRVSQAVINLINNAIKFSPMNSSIEIRMKMMSLGEIKIPEYANKGVLKDGRFAAIIITDHGPGLEADKLARVFDRFYQVENINTRAVQGTGLGLNIVKNIVELHNGAVWAESEGKGKGTTFIMIFPEV